MTLRPYQQEAVDAMVDDYTSSRNVIVVLPQGSGKSHVIAELARKIDGNILITAPNQELVKQDYEKLVDAGVSPDDIGIYAGSLKRYEIKKYTVGIINSIWRNPDAFSSFNCAIIDECDLVNEKEMGMYRIFFKNYPDMKCYGLTATPYRNVPETRYEGYDIIIETKLHVLTREGNFWDDIIYCKNIADMTPENLVPVKYIHRPVTYGHELRTNSTGMEYTDMSINAAFMKKGRLDLMADEIKRAEKEYRSILVFCPGVVLCDMLSEKVPGSVTITGETGSKERAERVEGFKSGKIKTVFSVDVLTAGFNYSELECIVLLRPTKSIRKYQQMVGRVMRKATIWTGDLFNPTIEKECGVLLDLTTTSRDMGPVEEMNVKHDGDAWELYKYDEPMHGEIIGRYVHKR